ncbi:hypothetical protein KEM56_002419 [Ascosphaera pollenicola]|nr:hypothetical protein KEM56_002419 [Ascosphaera pollenicola]
MLGSWSAWGHPHIKSMDPDQHIAFISDVGAFSLKPLFISMSAISASLFTSVFVIERWLRHARQLAPNTNQKEKVFACISIFFAIMGACGIIFLSIFDTWNHNSVHDAMLVLFIVGYILSAVFVCLEYYSLGLNYPEHKIMKISFILKAAFIVIEFTLAVAFASESRNGNRDVAGVLEWSIRLPTGSDLFSQFTSGLSDLAARVSSAAGGSPQNVIPASMQNASPEEQQQYLKEQKEKLANLLRAYDTASHDLSSAPSVNIENPDGMWQRRRRSSGGHSNQGSSQNYAQGSGAHYN